MTSEPGDESPTASVTFRLDRDSRTFFSGEDVTGVVGVVPSFNTRTGGVLLELRGEVLTPDYAAR